MADSKLAIKQDSMNMPLKLWELCVVIMQTLFGLMMIMIFCFAFCSCKINMANGQMICGEITHRSEKERFLLEVSVY